MNRGNVSRYLLPLLRRPGLAMVALALVLALTARGKPSPVAADAHAGGYVMGQFGKRMTTTP